MPPPVLGIVGAGQLARMTAQATIGLDLDLRVFAERRDDSAAQVSPRVTVGAIGSVDDLDRFAGGCDVVTFDHELVPPAVLTALAGRGHTLRPAPAALAFAQDKLHQRRTLGARGLPVPAHAAVGDAGALAAFGDRTGWPVVAKARHGGYDGRGVWVLDDPDGAADLWAQVGGSGALMVEAYAAIERELAVVVARRPGGATVTYPVVETVQVEGVLRELVVPAGVPDEVADEARSLATRVVEAAGGVGIVAVELFQTPAGLLVNELALRPHNSAHWTIEGAVTSQFENHARAVLDWPLGGTALTAPAVATVNVLGRPDGAALHPRRAAALAVPGVHVHLYGKEPRPGRKVGHVTALGDDPAETRGRARRAAARLTGTEVDG